MSSVLSLEPHCSFSRLREKAGMRVFFLLSNVDGCRPPHNQPARRKASPRYDRSGAEAVAAPSRSPAGRVQIQAAVDTRPLVVDFCCLEARLIVEVDGGQHNEEADAVRTAWLEAEGFRVRRNNDVVENLGGVLATLAADLRGLYPGRHSKAPEEA